MKKIDICIIGARSYSSGILIKYLVQHKHVNINMLISESKEEDIRKIHPFLHGIFEGKTQQYEHNEQNIVESNDLIFLHKSHGEFFEKTAKLIELSLKLKKDVRFIDLSADFRLKDKNLYDKWYKFKHTNPELLQKAVYGLTELYREKIKNAVLVANPGCYPTATLLAVAPLFKGNFADTNQSIIIDAISGSSGAGNSNGLLAIDLDQNIKPYKIGYVHQHIPEIEQEISNIVNKKIGVIFAPHVASFTYGILSTNFIRLKEPYKLEDIDSIYKKMYGSEPFIRILDKPPELKDVVGTNFCDLGISIDEHTKTCIAMSVIDNVIKGASGQAIQNMNVMYGFEETEGLPYGEVLRAKKAHSHREEHQQRAQLNKELIQ